MEMLSYFPSGELSDNDSQVNTGVIKLGDAAGTGIIHSGFNASPDEAEGSLSLHQNARAYASVLEAGREVSLEVSEGRGIWVQTAEGRISIGNGFGSAGFRPGLNPTTGSSGYLSYGSAKPANQ
jgi:redox-sensitive bicupin YhaK (pirin superfamily)